MNKKKNDTSFLEELQKNCYTNYKTAPMRTVAVKVITTAIMDAKSNRDYRGKYKSDAIEFLKSDRLTLFLDVIHFGDYERKLILKEAGLL